MSADKAEIDANNLIFVNCLTYFGIQLRASRPFTARQFFAKSRGKLAMKSMTQAFMQLQVGNGHRQDCLLF